ncbi:MAG: hypothetical protein HFE76_10370 [Firmicutes bacterium]|nr:hypothetical protein [Bacillota bacterium]
MKVRDNASGRTAVRYLGQSNSKLSKTLEKLSSGYRINRSADDASGLAISEKMRMQITGMGQAQQNSQDGVSLIQVGEGSLGEIHTMLNRAVELAEQSANGTYKDEIDREALQKELDQLCDDIDRITEGTNFNGIKLFQNKGLAYESSTPHTSIIQRQEQQAARAKAQSAAQQAAVRPQTQAPVQSQAPVQAQAGDMTLEDVLANQKSGECNIVYVDRTDFVQTTQTPGGTSTLQGNDIKVGDKMLSDILKTEIIPNTVQNILANYPAFSYLNGSNIGIGLEYYNDPGSGGSRTLAYVKGQVATESTNDGTTIISRKDFITYTLGVNTHDLSSVVTPEGRAKLEATIAHEMIHAFMDEATTSGMFGVVEGTGTKPTAAATKFPDWFVEGMAQTASGPGNWLESGGLNISASSSGTTISNAITFNKLGSGTTASQYGTGYLACMYLGATIEGGGTPSSTVSASTISSGLNKLLNEVIGGTSLNAAIKSLTNNKFNDVGDFVTKFNSGPYESEIASFVQNLLTATGNGLGGIVSGNLAATDLTPDTNLGDTIKLFQLDPEKSSVKNLYPPGYKVYSGGTTDAGGTAPTDFNPADPVLPSQDCGDLTVSGAKANDIEYDANTGTLTVKSGLNITISMKTPGAASSLNKIILDGAQKVTLNGVNLSQPDALTIKQPAEITYQAENEFSEIKVDGTNLNDIYFYGNGQIKTGTFTSDASNTVKFKGGAVIVGADGSGSIDSDVTIDNASVAADIKGRVKNPAGTELKPIEVPWPNQLSGFGDIASVKFDGASSPMLIKQNEPGKLWLDPASAHRITFTDSAGASKTLAAVFDATASTFKWQDAKKPFTVRGGTEGVDYDYEDDGTTLVIKKGTALTISGGTTTDENGKDLLGRIKVTDGVGAVDLTLDTCKVSATNASAFDLGEGNTVTLNLKDGVTSNFSSGDNYAGIAVGKGSNLTINGKTGVLTAKGGRNSAGIGRSSASTTASDPSSSIIINGGNITANGGYYGAGIGAGDASGFGDITINGGTIEASGGIGGAGIGGANSAAVGNITITAGNIIASSKQHGAGIGGGWGSAAKNGTINISGGYIMATSQQHGTGIGAGCSANSGKITISGGTIHRAIGGDSGAGIGASWNGSCGDIEICGDAEIQLAEGGSGGAGIGAGNQNSKQVGTILIETEKSVNAKGGTSGVGIGSGHSSSSCGDISIKKGTVNAEGATDSTGIGAGRGSTSGNITIGDPANLDNQVIVNATGGMTNNGGNIMSYADSGHTKPGVLTIAGNNTTVRPGSAGEGLYSTSGAVDADGNDIYAYPVYLFQEADGSPLAAGDGLSGLPLPDGAKNITISATGKTDGLTKTWEKDLTHEPLDKNYVFVWMSGQDQTLSIDYTDPTDGSSKTVTLDLKFHSDSGTFRIASQPKPPAAEKPGYVTNPDPPPVDPDKPNPPVDPKPDEPDPPIDPVEPLGNGGIILQIGANYGETLEVPLFYLSLDALKMGELDISTQENAWESMSIVRNAIERVSEIRGTYGAMSNRLEHNQQSLSQTIENTTAAESRIRDADLAKEYMKFVRFSINSQASQAMAAHSNQNMSQVLQLLQ